MKRLLAIFFCCTLLLAATPEEKVYICVSRTSEKYHARPTCRGLSSCTHEIKAVTLQSAVENGRSACKVCY